MSITRGNNASFFSADIAMEFGGDYCLNKNTQMKLLVLKHKIGKYLTDRKVVSNNGPCKYSKTFPKLAFFAKIYFKKDPAIFFSERKRFGLRREKP